MPFQGQSSNVLHIPEHQQRQMWQITLPRPVTGEKPYLKALSQGVRIAEASDDGQRNDS